MNKKYFINKSIILCGIFACILYWSTSGYADTFPETSIKTWNSPSEYAGDKNVFTGLGGQCTWYVYGRIIELAEGGYIAQSVKTKFKDTFCCVSGRHANNWDNMLKGDWFDTTSQVLPLDKRRKGLVAVWEKCDPDYGHVGFVEEISANKKNYRLTDFNWKGGKENYHSGWYCFDSSDCDENALCVRIVVT